MGIDRTNTKRIKEGFSKIFWATQNDFECRGKNKDGSYSSVGILVQAIHDVHFEELKKLTGNIPHPLAIYHLADGIQLLFFTETSE